MDLIERLEQFRAEEEKLNWEGKFSDYWNLVVQNPRIAQLAHARIYDMIMSAGVEPDDAGHKQFRFFEGEIFGLERTLEQLVEYFNSASKRLEVRKRILLMMGPVGGGKSTIVTLLKRGLERYTRSDEGAIYAIKGCPMHEEPLHLIPDVVRPDIQQGVRHVYRGRPLPPLPGDAAGEVWRQGRGRGGRADRLQREEQGRHRHLLSQRPEDPGHQRADRLDRPVDDRRVWE